MGAAQLCERHACESVHTFAKKKAFVGLIRLRSTCDVTLHACINAEVKGSAKSHAIACSGSGPVVGCSFGVPTTRVRSLLTS